MLSGLVSSTTVSGEQRLDNPIQPSTVGSQSDWWYCTWTSSAAEFKKRKFQCKGINYNSENGYIELISFEEVIK